MIGAGTYADDRTAAVSCTGTGEAFIRVAAAHDVCARMAYGARTSRWQPGRLSRSTCRLSAAAAG